MDGTRPGSAAGVNGNGNGNGNGKEMVELDGRETAVGRTGQGQGQGLGVVREDGRSGVFELPGTGVEGVGSREIGRRHGDERVSALVGDERADGEPPSPLTGTGTWNGNGNANGVEGVSPDSPVWKRGGRPF